MQTATGSRLATTGACGPVEGAFPTSILWHARAAVCVTVIAVLATVAPHRANSAEPGPDPRVEQLLEQMTLDEKIGQLEQAPGGRSKALNSKIDAAELERVRHGAVGSYLHVAGAQALRDLQAVAVEESRLGIPLLFAMDVVHGYRTIFPVPIAMASSWDPELARTAARIAAVEASASGLHWTFAPMVDIAGDPRWGRIVEGAGEDPFLGSAMAAAQVQGFQGTSLSAPDSLLASTKHFGAYGAAQGGRDYDSAEVSERALHEVYLPPFYAAAQAGTGSFMTAFNDIGGVPTTANRALLRGLVRDAWRYEGLIVSDWNAIAELMNHGVALDRSAAARLALSASIDMDMAGGVYAHDLKPAISQHPQALHQLDEAVRRVLSAKTALGLFDNPYHGADPHREQRVLLSAEHRAVARDVARKSIVLLRNNESLLPLRVDGRTIAVIGALADDASSALGSWRAQGRPEDVKTLLQGVREAVGSSGRVVYEPGASPRSQDLSGIDRAVAAARSADVVLLAVGEDYDLSGEARSRSDLALPGAQQAVADAVLSTGKPVVVVLMNGRPVILSGSLASAPTLLETWFLGVESGPAIADVLFGIAAPGGKLPVSWPRVTGQAPSYYAHYPTGRPADPDLTKDTARYMDLAITPLFPFGHGLSYTTFDYSDLQMDTSRVAADGAVTISVTVRNSGKAAGDEVVQLYVRDPVASVSRPVKQLRGFKRIALAPDQSARVSFRLSAAQLAIYEDSGRWNVEPGRIDVMIGSSSEDIRATGAFEITTGAVTHAPAAALPTPVSVQF